MDRLNYLLAEYLKERKIVSVWVDGSLNVKGKIKYMGFEFVKIEKESGELFLVPVDKISMIRVE